MFFDGAFRHIGKVDPQPLVQVISSLGDDAWDDFEARQRVYDAHRHTQTIPLLFDMDGRHANPTTWPRFRHFNRVIQPALEVIRNANAPSRGNGQDGYFIRIILTRLSPGTDIPPHHDDGDSLVRSHRYHLALTTNPLVEFEVGGEIRHFDAGEIWEINNRLTHAVRNRSEEARVHMILDYVLPGEEVHDPAGLVTA